ncbi:MAG TPA: diacylglycerol kinase family protein [Polyangiales bacterium]|nr:diacylglycerol kinase family protein [Polyangiales bacterium]
MTQERVASVIFNEGSGSHASDELRESVEAGFAAQGMRVQWLAITRPALAASRERAVADLIRRAEGVLAVAGGDGTINAVASACRKLDRPLGILPAGTFNYIARNLGIPTEVEAAARVIAQGHAAPILVGEINGHLFLNNAGFGLYSHIIEQRELDKRRFGRHRVVAFASGLKVLTERHPHYHIKLETDGQQHSLRTTTLFFGVNALQLENYNVEAAKYVQRGQLAVLSLRLDSRLDIAAAAWAALRGKTEAASCVDAAAATSVHITTRRRGVLKVAIDGEIMQLRAPLHVRAVQAGLQVMLPEPRAEQAEPTPEPAAAVS